MFLIVTFSQRGSLLSGAGVIRFGRMVANPDRTAFFWDYFRLGGDPPGTRKPKRLHRSMSASAILRQLSTAAVRNCGCERSVTDHMSHCGSTFDLFAPLVSLHACSAVGACAKPAGEAVEPVTCRLGFRSPLNLGVTQELPQEFEILRNTLWNRGSLRKGANVGSTGRYGIQPDRSIYALSRQSSACSYSCSPT
jgi:hypothetical protein